MRGVSGTEELRFTRGEQVDPAKHTPMPLPSLHPAVAAAAEAGTTDAPSSSDAPFRFLSVFKWEERKGWDILLR